MNDDELRDGLKRALRDEALGWEREAPWRALCEGSDGARGRVEASAASTEEDALALAAFRPLGSDFEEQVVRDVLGARASSVAAAPSRPRRKRAFVFAAISLAAAAAFAIWVAPPRPGAPLAYALAMSSNAEDERGPASAAPSVAVRLSREAYFQAVARPPAPAAYPVGARAALVRDGRPQRWSVPLDVSAEGAVRLAGPAAKLFPETRGAYDVVVAVARRDALPDDDALLACIEHDRRTCAGATLVRGHVEFLDD